MSHPEDEETREQPSYQPAEPSWPAETASEPPHDPELTQPADGVLDTDSPAPEQPATPDAPVAMSDQTFPGDPLSIPEQPGGTSEAPTMPEAPSMPEATTLPDTPDLPEPPVVVEAPAMPEPPSPPWTPAAPSEPPVATPQLDSVDEQTTTMLRPVPPAAPWQQTPAAPQPASAPEWQQQPSTPAAPLPPAAGQVQQPPAAQQTWQQQPPAAPQQWQQGPPQQWQQQPPQQWQQPPYAPPPPGYAQGQQGWSDEPGYSSSAFAAVAGLILVLFGLALAAIGAWAFTQGPEIGRFIRDNDIALFGRQIDRPTLTSVLSPMPAILIVIGILQLLSGAGIFAHKSWARALGLLLALVSLVVALFAVSMALALSPGASIPVIVTVVLLIGYAFVVLALMAGGKHFRRRYPPAR